MFNLTPEDWTAIALSLRIAVVATVVSLPFGIAIAGCWRAGFWGKTLLEALIYLPLVLPPVVTGYLLLITLRPARRRSAHSSPIISASCSRSAGPAR